ncbi:heme exporter protein CcmD [Marinobacter sp. C2H3]|uniref:heme exporter protein CcmD n=1 Tax=Marinobacter sp. C2H3 TaxID=3119003 RepID=UPI00300F3CE5
MAFESFEAFLAMGGRGVYVWSSYGAFAVILVTLVLQSVVARRAVMRGLRQRPSTDQASGTPVAPARFERVAWPGRESRSDERDTGGSV